MELYHFTLDSTGPYCRTVTVFDVVLEARSDIGLDRQLLTTPKCTQQALVLLISLKQLLISTNPEGRLSTRRLQLTSMQVALISPSLISIFSNIIFQIPMRSSNEIQFAVSTLFKRKAEL